MSAGTSMSGGGGAASVAGATSSGSLGFIYGGRLPPRPPAVYILNQLGLIDPNADPSSTIKSSSKQNTNNNTPPSADPKISEVEVVTEIPLESDIRDEETPPNQSAPMLMNQQLLCAVCGCCLLLVVGIITTVAIFVTQTRTDL